MSMISLNPGLKAAVRSQGKVDKSAADILGPAYRHDVDARVGYWAPGTPPEVASAVNRGLVGAGGDLVTAAASTRPDAETTGGHENWDFKGATGTRIFKGGIPNIYEIADAISLSMVVDLDGAVPVPTRSYGGSYQGFVDGRGLWIWSATQFACRIPSGAGVVTLVEPAPPAGRFVVRATHTGNVDLQGELWINNIKVASSVVGTQDYFCDSVNYGKTQSGFGSGDFDMNRGTVIANAPADVLSEYDQYLMDLYEVAP